MMTAACWPPAPGWCSCQLTQSYFSASKCAAGYTHSQATLSCGASHLYYTEGVGGVENRWGGLCALGANE